MNYPTQGYGNSTVATKYVYQVVHGLLDSELDLEDIHYELSRFMDQLAHAYHVDTGKKIGEM